MKGVLELLKTTVIGGMFVLVPRAPTPFTGFVKIVPRDQVEPLDASLGDVTRTLGHGGVGLHSLVAERKSGQKEIP